MPGVRSLRSPLLLSSGVLGVVLAAPLLAAVPASAAEEPAAQAQSPPAADNLPMAEDLPAAEEPPATESGPEPAAETGETPEAQPEPEPLGDPFNPPAPGAEPQTPAEAPLEAPLPGQPLPSTPQTEPLLPSPTVSEPKVLITEVVIEGLSDHPEREQLELAAYDAMRVRPGMETTRTELRDDLAAIYATGWFSDARIEPVDSPLGVRLVVTVVPNPVLTSVRLDPPDAKIPETVVQETFAPDYGRTLNLSTLQQRMQEMQKWYADEGYSLARVTGPGRVSPGGEVVLQVRQGTVEGVEVQFLNREGSSTDAEGRPLRGKTRTWVITREISMKPGQIFNRRNLEEDLKRLYGTGLFSDVKVTLRPVADEPGRVTIVLGIVEQSTGSLSGGLGYSQSQGVFGQIQIQDSNLFGRAWNLSTSFTYGQFGGLADISFTDPWIKGDPYRTAFRLRAFVSRDVPQIFRSQDDGDIVTADGFYEAPGTEVAFNIRSFNNPAERPFGSVSEAEFAEPTTSWFDFDGNSIVIQRIGGNFQFVRPLNGGNPFRKAPWSVLVGLNIQEATPMDFSGDRKTFGLAEDRINAAGTEIPTDSVFCLAYNCADSNQLVGLRLAATMNTLDDPRNPTRGNFFSFGTEQFISVGPDSPTFNRLKSSFTHFIPVKWLKFYKGCRPRPGETEDCKQALALQFSAGTSIGDLPPYEAFCLGGGNSVRGYYDCDLGVGKSFGEFTLEYRFPLFRIISGQLFFDAGTTFGTQDEVQGRPGELLNKPGSGFSVGTGVIVTTPVGPLRLEVASEDFSGDWRFNLGVGWKF